MSWQIVQQKSSSNLEAMLSVSEAVNSAAAAPCSLRLTFTLSLCSGQTLSVWIQQLLEVEGIPVFPPVDVLSVKEVCLV